MTVHSCSLSAASLMASGSTRVLPGQVRETNAMFGKHGRVSAY